MSERKTVMSVNGTEMFSPPSNILIPTRDEGKKPVLDVRGLGIDFGGLRAVDEFTITVSPTEISGLIGPKVSVKTTVFNMMTNVYKPTRGAILLDGHPTAGKSVAQVNRMGIARTFQNIRLFDQMTVLDNVRVGMSNNIRCNFAESFLRLPGYFKAEKRSRERALELLSIFHMESEAYTLAGNLPYGAQRRLEIIRALATEPKVLLLDEPAAGMNPSETHALMESIRQIRDQFGIAIVLIEHDMNLVMGVCEGIAVLNFGKVIAKGTPDQIKNNEAVIEAYLGRQEKKEA